MQKAVVLALVRLRSLAMSVNTIQSLPGFSSPAERIGLINYQSQFTLIKVKQDVSLHLEVSSLLT